MDNEVCSPEKAAEQMARRYEKMQGIQDYHNKRQTNRRKEDGERENLIIAIGRALRLKDIDQIKEVLRFALEKTTVEKGENL